jgi:hypothetical protein
MITNQIIALGFPLAAAAVGAATLLARRFWLRSPKAERIDPAQIDIAVAMTNIREAMMKEIERANRAGRRKTTT